jgi:hypothetical protein
MSSKVFVARVRAQKREARAMLVRSIVVAGRQVIER